MRALIFITWPVRAWSITRPYIDELERRFPNIEFAHAATRDDVPRLIGDADIAFTPHLMPEWIAGAPKLKWVHSSAAAVEGLLPLRELDARGIVVSNSRGIQAIPIAEHVIGGLLVLARKFDRMIHAQRERRWIQNDLVDDYPTVLYGKRMTIVGLGTIGLEVAKRAHAFGMNVTGIKRRIGGDTPVFVEQVLPPEKLHESLRNCDVLVLSTPGVAATRGMIRAEELSMLNRGALLVNVARAAVVDERAMIDALESGQLGGAVLDVFEKEPLDQASPLWSMRNVLISPHASGFRANHWDDVIDLFADNLRRFQSGTRLKNEVDLAAGY